MSGGAKKSIEIISGGAKKSSKKTSSGAKKGTNPGFQAFLDLKKKIADTLKVSNSPKVGKVAGAVQKIIKETTKDLSSVEISKKAFELFNSNVSKYAKMLE